MFRKISMQHTRQAPGRDIHTGRASHVRRQPLLVSQILEIGRNLVVSSACVMVLGVRQDFVNEQRQFNSDETAVVARIAVRAPRTTDH